MDRAELYRQKQADEYALALRDARDAAAKVSELALTKVPKADGVRK